MRKSSIAGRQFTIIMCAILIGCSPKSPNTDPLPIRAVEQPVVAPMAEILGHVVEAEYPHDTKAFTQGLVVHRGQFLESTGQYGQSSLRRVDIKTGRIIRKEALENAYFGEGLTVLNGVAYVLTWLNQTCLLVDPTTLKVTDTFRYSGEGWGITNDGQNLIMSNGTNVLTVFDPARKVPIRTIAVTLNGLPCANLNELEWIDGMIWANVWQSDKIVRIDPASGTVTGVVDLTGLLPANSHGPDTDVLNGIAWDSTSSKLYVTGKNWPSVYRISIR